MKAFVKTIEYDTRGAKMLMAFAIDTRRLLLNMKEQYLEELKNVKIN